MAAACKPPSPRLVVVSDIDGTLVDASYRVPGEAARLAGLLQDAGVFFVLATSKTLEEARLYAGRLGLDPVCPGYALVVEEGGLVWAPGRVLPGGPLVLGSPLSRGELEELLPPGCRGAVRPVWEMDAGEVSALTGLPPVEAEAARRRRVVAALHGPRWCLEEGLSAALSRGLYARLGRVFLMLGRIKGKAHAVGLLLRRSPVLRHAPVVALGDSEMDAEMLEEADEAVVVPRDGGWLRLRRGDYLVAPGPAPHGWLWAMRRLAERHVAGLAPRDQVDR